MNAKKLLALSLACTLTLGLSACGGGQDAPSSSSPSGASDGDALKVGIILSTGGLGDKNFNDMTYAGAQQAEKDFGIEFDYVETQSASDFLPNYRMFAESGEYDLIIGLAADQTEAINEISIDFPEQKISHIDSSTDLPNVSAVYTKWQEQTFLTGVVAGLGTLSGMDKANSENVVGVILGQDQPTLRMGVVGFEAGVRYVNPDCEVLEAVVGDFNDPAKAKRSPCPCTTAARTLSSTSPAPPAWASSPPPRRPTAMPSAWAATRTTSSPTTSWPPPCAT